MNSKKMRSFFYCMLILSLIFITILIHSQSGLLMSVYGNVTDLNSNESLSGITIYFFKIENGEITTISEGTSDSYGFYKVRYLEPGLYRFQIEIPEIGNIYIGRIGTYIHSSSIIAESADEDYLIEIYEGKNVNFNVFLGESSFPNINRIDNKEKNIIDFSLYYVNDTIIDSENNLADSMPKQQINSRQNPNSCPGLAINNVVMQQVADTYRIMYRGNECVALYIWQQSGGLGERLDVGMDIRCPKPRCKCSYDNFKGIFHPYIIYHSNTWVKNTWANVKGIQISDDCAACLNQSYIVHEQYHESENRKFITDEFCDFQTRMLNKNINCTERAHCIPEAQIEARTMITNIHTKLGQTEQDAFNNQETYYNSNCLNKCNNIPFWTIIR